MPISVTLNNLNPDFLPQFYGYSSPYTIEANFKVTPPYREDNVILMQYSPRSTAPSSVNIGVVYYNTTDKMLYIYTSAGWATYGNYLKTRDEGYVYYCEISSSWYTYDRANQTMTKLTSWNAWNHIYVKVESISTTPPANPSRDTWWYSPTNMELKWYSGSTWNGMIGTISMSSYHVWIAFNNFLYCYDGSWSTSNLRYCYNSFKVNTDPTGSSGVTKTQPYMGGKIISFNSSYTWVSDDARTFTPTVTWYSDDSATVKSYVPEQNSYTEEYTIPTRVQGRWGGLNASVSVISTLPTYVQEGDEITVKLQCTPNSTYTASVAIPSTAYSKYECERFGVHWVINRGYTPSITDTLEEAVNGGLVSVTNINRSGYNFSEVSLKLLMSDPSIKYYIGAYIQYFNGSPTQKEIYKILSPITVYKKTAPAITLVSSTPDITVYPPPYSATLRDDTPSGQVPVTSVTLDAGDNQDVEVWKTSTHVSTVRTHIYNGYGAYRPSITVVDGNGNSVTATTTFAPNKEPRPYVPPGELDWAKIVYDGTRYRPYEQDPTHQIEGEDAPILLECYAFVAGSPLPEVLWKYVDLDTGSEYYSGEKEGEFAEIVLLAGGNYRITCTVTSGNTTLGEYTWNASATSVVIPETPVLSQDFTVWVYDSSDNRIDRLLLASAQYTDRFAHASYCEFSIPMDYQHIDRLVPGCKVSFGYLGKARLMIVTGFDEDADNNTVTITAMDAASYALQSRVATVATRSTLGNGYDVQTCSAEALLRYFAVSNILTGNRRIPDLQVVGTCTDAGGKTTYSARYEDILTIFEDICSSSGLGWDSALQSATQTTFSLKVINPTDRTYNDTNGGIIFEDRTNGRKSATLGNYSGFLGANLAIAAGEGNGSSRPYYEFTKINYRTIVTANQSTHPLKVTDGSHGTIAGKTYYACKEMSTGTYGYYCPEMGYWVTDSTMTGDDLELVDKLVFAGGQKIDTGFTSNQNTSIRMAYKVDNIIGQTIYGAYGSTWETNNYGVYYNSSGATWGNYNCDTQFAPTPDVDLEHTVYQNKNELYVDNILKLTHSSATFTSDTTLKIGRCDGILESMGYKLTGYIKYAQIWDNGTLVRDMVPIKYGSTYAMLDKQNWVIYTNVGTGTFTGGDVTGYIQYADCVAGLERYEVFVDAGDSANNLEIQRQAEQELAKQDEQTLTIYPNESVYKFGTDYNVGDYVTVRTKSGIRLDLQIIQANCSIDETGKQLSLELGTDLRDYQRLIREGKLANTYARK